MSDKIKMGVVTVDRMITAAKGLNGLKKHKKVVVKALAGKYAKTGRKLKIKGKDSTELIKQIRSKV